MWGMGGRSCKDIQVTAAASKVQAGMREEQIPAWAVGSPGSALLYSPELWLPSPLDALGWREPRASILPSPCARGGGRLCPCVCGWRLAAIPLNH